MGRTIRFSFMTLVYAFLYLPIIVLIANSFNENKFGMKWGGFTTKWYHALMNNDSLMQAAWHSFNVAIFSATAATIIGSLTAVALFRYHFKGKKAVNGMLFRCHDVTRYRDGDFVTRAVFGFGCSTWFLYLVDCTHYFLLAVCCGDSLQPSEWF